MLHRSAISLTVWMAMTASGSGALAAGPTGAGGTAGKSGTGKAAAASTAGTGGTSAGKTATGTPATAAAPPPPAEPVPASDLPRAGSHTHDGFYLRMAIGPAYVFLNSDVTIGTASASGSVSGPGLAGELMLGGTVAPGLVVGGGSQGAVLPSGASGTIKASDGTSSDLKTTETGVGNMIGPFADYYFKPQDGLHAQLLLGYAQYQAGSSDSGKSSGFGVSAGFGNEWWVADEWSIGVLGRLQYFSLKGSGAGTPTLTAYVPAALISFTYH